MRTGEMQHYLPSFHNLCGVKGSIVTWHNDQIVHSWFARAIIVRVYLKPKLIVEDSNVWKFQITGLILGVEHRIHIIQYHSFIWKRSFLDTWQHHGVMPLNTQLIAIEMNPKPFFLSQIIHLFQNCVHLKKIVTFPYNFGHHKHFPPKFQILVV